MDGGTRRAADFEASRPRLRAIAYRMLGSLAEADDAVQETWLRLSRTGAGAITSLESWLTTVVARVCLDALRARASRAEEPLEARLPEPVVVFEGSATPEAELLLGDAIGLGLQVVLEELAPAERLAFVLHDLFAVPFEQIASLVERTPEAARQLASRGRRKVAGASPPADAGAGLQRGVVDAFLTAAHGGDLGALLAILAPDVVLRTDRGVEPPAAWREVRGAKEVAGQAQFFARLAGSSAPVRVNGEPGIVAWLPDGAPMAVLAFTVRAGRVVAIWTIADAARLARLELGPARG